MVKMNNRQATHRAPRSEQAVARPPTGPPAKSPTKQLGDHGEALARAAYERAGYRVLAQNWFGAAGELDLLVAHRDTLVVCEVKTRTSDKWGLPAEAVDWRKQRRVRRLAAEFLRSAERRYATVRFDVASVIGDDVRIIENAF